MGFLNKVVVVTGGAQGIGKCIAEEFHREGAIGYDPPDDLPQRQRLETGGQINIPTFKTEKLTT